MKTIPNHVSAYSTSPVFTEDTIPDRLRHDHHTKDETWAEIHVEEGVLLYYIDDANEPERLTPERFGVIEPNVRHRVEPEGAVKFYIEFYH